MSFLSNLPGSGMSAGKAVDMILSGNDEKKEKGLEWISENPEEGYSAMIAKFTSGVSKDWGKKGQPPSIGELFSMICSIPDLTEDQTCLFISGYLKRENSIYLDEENIPEEFFEIACPAVLSALHDNNEGIRRRALAALEKMKLPEETLNDILPMISKENPLCDDAMAVLPSISGDLTSAAPALYGMLTVHPYGETAYKIIVSIKDRLPFNIDAMKNLFSDRGSKNLKRAVAVTLAYSETDNSAYDLLSGAVRSDENVRTAVIDVIEKKEILSEADMDMAWDSLVLTDSDFTIARALRILPGQGKMSLSLFLYQIRNGDDRAIIYALRCLAAMKERVEFAGKCINPLNDPADMEQAVDIVLSDLADERNGIFAKIRTADYPHLGNFLTEKGMGYPETSEIAGMARKRCNELGISVPPEILASLGDEELSGTVDETIRAIFAAHGKGYDDAFAEKFTAGMENILLLDKTIVSAAIKAAGYVFSLNSYNNEIKIINNEANAAINRLRTINNPASSNILNLISRKKDLTITVCPENEDPETSPGTNVVVLSFENQRQTADAELERRGFPAYNPKGYLKRL